MSPEHFLDNEHCHNWHPVVLEAMMQQLDDTALKELADADQWEIAHLAERILRYRKKRRSASTHKHNYPINEVLDDYIYQRTGRLVEAKRQLRKRFDGLDHDMQETVMMAFMEYGNQTERNFIYGKLYGDDFWTDEYIPLIQQWHKDFPEDEKLIKVLVKYCPKEYILSHLDELKDRCNHATLCLRTGLEPDPELLPPWTYLFVLKNVGGQLRLRMGEETVLKWVRQFLYEQTDEGAVRSLYDIPYVRRMLAYLGEMGMVDDILAIDALEQQMSVIPAKNWATAVIAAIEKEFSFPPFVYDLIR